MKNEKTISRIATLILFLALFRTLSEPFRLRYFEGGEVCFDEMKLYLIGGLLCSFGLLLMTVLNYYRKFSASVLVAIAIVIGLLLIKYLYLT